VERNFISKDVLAIGLLSKWSEDILLVNKWDKAAMDAFKSVLLADETPMFNSLTFHFMTVRQVTALYRCFVEGTLVEDNDEIRGIFSVKVCHTFFLLVVQCLFCFAIGHG